MGRDDEGEADLATVAQEASEAPGAAVATLASTEDGAPLARVVVTDDGTGFLFTDDLPTLPEGSTYQLWRLAGEEDPPVSLGLVGDGSQPVTAVAVPADTSTLALSSEVASGVVAPTTVVAAGPVVR
jgi:anti-sigma-K factor RskA